MRRCYISLTDSGVTASASRTFKPEGGGESLLSSASQADTTAGQIHPPHRVIAVSGRITCHAACQIPVRYGSMSTSPRPPGHQILIQSHIRGMCWNPGPTESRETSGGEL